MRSSHLLLGNKYILNVFDFEAGDHFIPISRRNTNVDVFKTGFSNFCAYAFKGSFSREATAITSQSLIDGKGLYFTKISKGESLAKDDDEGKMDLVKVFTMVRYKALEPSSYVCVSHTFPFVNDPIPRFQIKLVPLIPYPVKENTCLLFPFPELVSVNGEKTSSPYCMSGSVTVSENTFCVEIYYG